MDQPGNGLDYDLAECLYNRFQYSSPYNNMLSTKTASTAPTGVNAAGGQAVKVTGGGVGVASSNSSSSVGKQNSSQLAGSNGSSASASSPTSTISSCSSSTNKSNGATKNSVSPVSSSNQQRSADISPRSISSEAKAADVAAKTEDKTASKAFNESFTDSQLSMDNNAADESGSFSPRGARLANPSQSNGKETSEDVEGEEKAEEQHDGNEKNEDHLAGEERKSRSRSKMTSGHSSTSPSPSSRSSQMSSSGSYMSRSGSYNNEDDRNLENQSIGVNQNDLNGGGGVGEEDDEENLDSVSVFSKNSFDKIKTSLSSNTESAIKTCFERKDEQQSQTRNKRKAYNTTNRESAASSPLQFGEEDEPEEPAEEQDSLQQPIKKQCTVQRQLDASKEEAVDTDTGYEKSELFLSDLAGLRERLIDAVNKVIYKTFESFCETKFKGADNKMESVVSAPQVDGRETPNAKSSVLNQKPQGLSVPYGAQNLRTREKPLNKPDENARFGATSLRHQPAQPFKSSLPSLPVKKVGDRIRTKQSGGSFHMTKLLENSNRPIQRPSSNSLTTPYSSQHHHHHSVRDDLKRRVMPNGSSNACVKNPPSNSFMASKLLAIKNEKPASNSSSTPMIKSEKTNNNSLLTNALMNELPGSRSLSNSLLTPSNSLMKSANGAPGAQSPAMSAAASLYAAAMSHLQQTAGPNAGNESARIGATSSPQNFNINHGSSSSPAINGGLGNAFPAFQNSLMPSLSSQINSPNNANTSASSTASSISSSASSNAAAAAAAAMNSQSQFAHHHQFLLSAAAAAAAAAAANQSQRDNGNRLGGVAPPQAPSGLLPGNQSNSYFSMAAAAAANRLFTPYLLDHHNQLGHSHHHQLASNPTASALANSLLAQQQANASASGIKLESASASSPLHQQSQHVNPLLGSYHHSSTPGHHHSLSSSNLMSSSSHGLFRTPGKRRRTKVTDTRLSPRNTSLRTNSSAGANLSLMNSLLHGQSQGHLYAGMHGSGDGGQGSGDDQENCQYDDSGVEYNGDEDDNMQGMMMEDGDEEDENGNGGAGDGDDESMSSTGVGGGEENRNELATMPNGYMNDSNQMNGTENGGLDMGSTSSTEYIGYQISTLSSLHLRKAKLMFFYTRYPSSTILRNYFPDVRFNKANTAQLVKWFSNFREFFYIQMEKYARQHLAEGLQNCDDLHVDCDSEIFRTLNSHYNRNNQLEIPPSFCYVIEATLKEFFRAIQEARDQDPSWKKAIYKIIARMDDSLPDFFQSIKWMQSLESSVV